MPYMMGFFVLGKLFRKWGVARKINIWLLFGGWLLFLIGAWCYPDLAYGYFSLWWYCYSAALAAVGCMLSCLTACSMSGQVVFLLSKLGVASMGIMLVHKFFILPFQIFSQMFITDQSFLMLFGVVVIVSTAVSIVAWLTTELIRRVAPWTIGEKEKNA